MACSAGVKTMSKETAHFSVVGLRGRFFILSPVSGVRCKHNVLSLAFTHTTPLKLPTFYLAY